MKPSAAEYNNCIGAWSNGSGYTYFGEWQNGKESGRGTATFSDGEKYRGEFRDGIRSGSGTDTFANGNKYVGEYKDNRPNGHGTFTITVGQWNGDQYVGDFKDGNWDGEGTYTYANGSKYVGQYKNSKPNGQGVLYASNGAIIEQGIYENGILKNNEAVTAQASGNNHRIQMVKDGGTYAVPVLINNVLTLHFIVDSGATDVTIPGDVALTLIRTGTIGQSDFIGSQKYQLADGSVIDSPQFIIHTLKVGDLTVENVRVSIGDVKGSLLLGQSFLEKFKAWSMDNVSHELVLE